jgi:hypothetical protein
LQETIGWLTIFFVISEGFFYRQKNLLIMKAPRYWIVVASQEHVMFGVTGGFAQAGHGKRSGLARMRAGDRIIYYSPKIVLRGKEFLHAFTALGEVSDNEIVQVEISPDFKPFRRNVKYLWNGTVKIEPLINDLEFIRNKTSWGYAFRFGLLEIQKPDFERIEQAFEKTSSPL